MTVRGGAGAYIWCWTKDSMTSRCAIKGRMLQDRIYLDWNATAPITAAAIEAMRAAAENWANPSSVHADGRRAKGTLEDCRERVAAGLGALPQQVIFTSGGTEALALALCGIAASRRIVAATEHAAVFAAAPDAAIVPVDASGVIDLAALDAMLVEGALVAVMHANNETGVLQPIDAVLELTRAKGALLLVDAVQTAGKMKLPAADFVAVSAHKLGGPPGVGALISRCSETLAPVQKGGGQERGLRGGTENLPGIAGFATALESRGADHAWTGRAGLLRARLETRLLAAGAEIFGAEAERLPTTSMLRMPGLPAAMQLIQFDLAGISVSSGSACSSGKVGKSHVLAAMGIDDHAAGEAVRVSLGWTTTKVDIDAFCDAWERIAERRRAA